MVKEDVLYLYYAGRRKPCPIRGHHHSSRSCTWPLTTAAHPHADQIDKQTLEIAQADGETYSNMQDLADELPDHSPRYVLLSYPLTLVRNPAAGDLRYGWPGKTDGCAALRPDVGTLRAPLLLTRDV